MDTTQVITVAGIAAAIIITQVGRHPVTLRRFLLPLAIAGGVAYHYLQGVPAIGGTLDFEIALSLVGIALGVLAASMIQVERDVQTGRLVLQAGFMYAALWVIVFGGRLAFAWAATHIWTQQVMQFSLDHGITGSAAWTDAFVLMAVSMVLTRTLVVGARTLAAARLSTIPTAVRP